LLGGGNPWISFICATTGNWLGGLTSYWLGWLGKWKWLEKWFKIKQQTLEKQKSKIDRFGAGLAFLSWLPIVGDLFAIALGFYKVELLEVCAVHAYWQGGQVCSVGNLVY
jgi:membrane protein YqaA with SNARE-associated domain